MSPGLLSSAYDVPTCVLQTLCCYAPAAAAAAAAAGGTDRTTCELHGCCWQKAAGGVDGCFEPKQASWSTYEVLSSKAPGN
jgi:hypothetical protein